MRHRTVIATTAIALIGALVAIAGSATAATSKKVTCTINLVTQIQPGTTTLNPTATSGNDFGLISCGSPFGHGVQSDSFTITPTSATAGSVSGPYKQYYDTGTLHGTFSVTFVATSATSVAYTGTYRIAGGTGAFKHAKGTGTLNCTSADGGIHTSCTGKATLSHT